MTMMMVVAMAALGAFAEKASVRIGYGTSGDSMKKIVRVERKTVELKDAGNGKWRFTMPRSEIATNAVYVDIVPDFMKAKKGDDGYWINGRGIYGRFDRDSGTNRWWRSQMPIFGVKRGNLLHWARMLTYRFDYDMMVVAKAGKYEVFPRIRLYRVREFFDPYDDIEIEFTRLEGDEADYNGMAKMYREERVNRGEIVPIKERMKTQPELEYLSEAMIIRLHTHCVKPRPKVPTDYYPSNEPPVRVHLPFDKSEEYVRAVKAAGVDKAAFVSAGWNAGGYDGRLPDHFPVEPAVGGEAGLKRLVRTTQDLGFIMMLHATNTEVYRVCPHFDESHIAKKRGGEWVLNGVYFGGTCYWICERCSWEGWIPREMRQMRELGVHGGHYVDVFSATYPNRCADSRHLATPEQMSGYQNSILAEARKVFGGVCSEGGYDHVAGNLDCINYVSVEMKSLYDGKKKGLELADGVYPLWELVYHGFILYSSDRLTQNHTRGQNHVKHNESAELDWMNGDGIVDPKISLKIVEFGGRPIFYTYKMEDVPAIARAVREFKPVRHLQRELMVSHREIAPKVFETRYGNGEYTICNYGEKAYRAADGREVAPNGYIIGK